MNGMKRRFDVVLHRLLWRPRLGGFGRRSRLYRPRMVTGARRIYIGDNCRIRAGARLEVVASDGRLTIESGVAIEDLVHIGAAQLVHIGRDVVIASMVTILDHDHGLPAGLGSVLHEPLTVAPVRIGPGAWIGEKATILKGVTVGAGAVVAAHAVVTKDVPDGGIVAGVPAALIRTRPTPVT